MLADLTGEVKESHIFCPVIVIDHLRFIGGVALEIKEFGELFLDRLLIMAKSLLIEEITLRALSGGVADHSCSPADKCERLMSATLEMTEHHDSAEMSDVKAVCRRVDPEISGGHTLFELFVCAGHNRVDHATPSQFFDEIHLLSIYVAVNNYS